MTRLIDLICDDHAQLILDTRMWPKGFDPTETDCAGCANCGRVEVEFIPAFSPFRIAAHEAGHAVARMHFGHDVIEVALGPHASRPKANGYVSVRIAERQKYGNASMITGWAGALAELRWLEVSGDLDDAATIDTLFTAAEDANLVRAGSIGDHHLTHTRTSAERLVDDFWTQIVTVAFAVRVRGRITGTDLAALPGLESLV